MSAALIIIALAIVLALGLGLRARSGREMSLEQWAVGGRGFGTLLVFLLMAGEIYTTFTFLGGSGWAYGKGAPAYYILAYGTLAYVLSYWMLPPVWRYAKTNNLYSQPDFFAKKYASRALGVIVALVGIVALVPYMVLQLKGLGIIMETASYGTISPTLAVWIGAAVVTIYVVVSGVRGSAWTAVVKDTAILVVVLFLGIYLPIHYYGGYGAMFMAIETAKPGFLALAPRGQSVAWFDSTVLLTALGFYMWPHTFSSLYTAKSDRVFRHNAVILPLYQLVLLFVFFVGFAAILQVPGLKGSDVDLALFRLSIQAFPSWFVGLVGAAGVLTALVPGSMILMAGATLVATTLFRAAKPDASEMEISRIAKVAVPILALVCVYFTLSGGNTIVQLLLMGYSFVTQLFPCFVASLMRRNPVTAEGAIAGVLVGVVTVTIMTIGNYSFATLFPALPGTIQDLNIGMVALAFNVIAMALVSVATRRVPLPQHA